ncbi:expressed unknown protein [Seminavis robusta]|uniref:Uncharacterized protein n=1 Tax=Seminavis robusta TaxID=568900 RepID=A0A9N8ET97_9STRA|nr:expressed unknown protein [Seminavis robusta]|eukprot:Sro1633_g287360.1 n/a (113) ;mRNA; f:8564-8902
MMSVVARLFVFLSAFCAMMASAHLNVRRLINEDVDVSWWSVDIMGCPCGCVNDAGVQGSWIMEFVDSDFDFHCVTMEEPLWEPEDHLEHIFDCIDDIDTPSGFLAQGYSCSA